MAQCISPFWKKAANLRPGEIAGPHPCGKCYPCVMRRLSGWHFRLANELNYCTSAYFITLTYDSDNVPFSDSGLLTLNKRDLQLFFKRLRKSHSSKTILKYYAIGEYGTKFDRPHYHAIVYNAVPDAIVDAWRVRYRPYAGVFKKGVMHFKQRNLYRPIGNSHIDEVTDASIGYVVGYTQKSFYASWGDEDRAPPFAHMSKHLGVNYLSPTVFNWHKKDLENRMYIPLDGKKLPMPRYFKNLIYDENERKRIAHFSVSRSEKLQQDKDDYMQKTYGERAAEVQIEMHKQLFKKLENKKNKRKL